ncbi:MAG: hypothetical protein MN733_09220, partial [Nitrososphaera sp.]|nr:hypothetical protein [Nitrososphaera sp.]
AEVSRVCATFNVKCLTLHEPKVFDAAGGKSLCRKPKNTRDKVVPASIGIETDYSLSRLSPTANIHRVTHYTIHHDIFKSFEAFYADFTSFLGGLM